jgi:hypothetical protein
MDPAQLHCFSFTNRGTHKYHIKQESLVLETNCHCKSLLAHAMYKGRR